MRVSTIIVMDFETGGTNPTTCEAIQLAAIALNPATLAPLPGAEFESLMRPLDPDGLEDEALAVNRKTKEELATAPHPAEVWGRFATWVSQFNFKGKNDPYTNPIMAGHNILNFDLPIVERYSAQYGTTRTRKNGQVQQNLFNTFYMYDTLQMLNCWTESLSQPGKLSMDYLRKFFKIPAGNRNAHDALQDVRDTAAILTKVLGWHRYFTQKLIWKGCFDPDEVAKEKERRAASRAKAKERETAAAARSDYRGRG